MTCQKCKADLPPGAFGKDPKRLGRKDPRCKTCIRESVKYGIRMNTQLPRLIRSAANWPDVQIESEIHWLTTKLEALAAEKQRRRRARS